MQLKWKGYRNPCLGSFIEYISKIFRKTNIVYPMICRRTCVYQGVRNVSFSENSVNILKITPKDLTVFDFALNLSSHRNGRPLVFWVFCQGVLKNLALFKGLQIINPLMPGGN